MTETARGAGSVELRGAADPSWQRERRGGETPVVPPARPRSYYGQPILKGPVWKPEIAAYLFTGGLAGGSAVLAAAARRQGNDALARRALLASFGAVSVCPVLLVKDLGRPERFHHMLRVVKVTSPMSVGSWVLGAAGGAVGVAAGCEVLGVLPRVRGAAELAAGTLGAPLSTYTAALLADTAVPAWSEARRELPVLFAASSLASAGAVAAVLTRPVDAALARRVAAGGAAVELVTARLIQSRREAGRAYREGEAARFLGAAEYAGAAGALMLALAGRSRMAAVTGGLALLAGSACLRWGVFKAGVASAKDPEATVGPQRRRLEV